MSVYLGETGCVHVRRVGEPYRCVLEKDNVSETSKRFSFDWDGDGTVANRPSPIITGDRLNIRRPVSTDNLVLVDGVISNGVTRWAHVDQTGGIRLYSSYREAITGGSDNALALDQHTADQEVIVDVENIQYESVAQMQSWEITTQRETVDTTILGEEFRAFYDQGLISGQGSINALWDYRFTECVDSFNYESELANYFSRLVIRFREGAKFQGLFIIHSNAAESVWYEADCICTNVGMTFAVGAPVTSTIQFVTTGQIALKQGEPPSYLLLEDKTRAAGDQILLETASGSMSLEYGD